MRNSRTVFVCTALVAATVFITPFRRELFVGDETKYGEVIREMRATGTFFVPILEGTPFTHKPPLHFWLVDALSFVFGVHSMWSFVLPSLAAFIAMLWLMRRMTGDWLASFVCGTSLLVWASAQSARMDVSFTLFLTIGAWMLFRFLESGEARELWWSAIAIGIATLIKGPMAPVIAIALFAFEWWRRKRVPRGPYAGAIIAMIVIPLLWFVPAVMIAGRHFVNEVVMKQTVGRAVGSWVHQSPPWFYVLHSPGTLFPWFLLFVLAMTYVVTGFSPSQTGLKPGPTSISRFSISWVLAVVVPYSLISSKLDVYMMAMIPPMAIIVAEFVRTESPRVRVANMIMAFILQMIAIAVQLVPLHGQAALMLQEPAVRGLLVMLEGAATLALIFIFLKRSALMSTLWLGFVPIAVMVYVAIALMPMANTMATTRPLIAALDAQRVEGRDIALYTCPHLWSRDMPATLDTVHYVGANNVGSAVIIATSRKYANDIKTSLAGYHHVAEVQMIGKWFDVYRK